MVIEFLHGGEPVLSVYGHIGLFRTNPNPPVFASTWGPTAAGSEATPSIVCRGNLEGEDQDVDGADLSAFMTAYGSSTGDANFNPAADINKDGTVDHNDLSMFAEEFGRMDCPVCQ